MTDVAKIAAGLSKAQIACLLAVGDAGAPYAPRHNRTAHWAIRHGFVEMLWRRVEDGRAVPWMHLTSERHSAEALGCILTPLGLAVRGYLKELGDVSKDHQPVK